MADEIRAKGIITAIVPQGETAKRLSLITDELGRVTAFASGAAKTNSKLIGKLRPFTAASFRLAKGRGAYRVQGVELIDAFEEMTLDMGVYTYGAYILETAEYYSREGMNREDAVRLLNLMYVTLSALRRGIPGSGSESLPMDLVRRIYELRLLKIDGEYSESPDIEAAGRLWDHTLRSPLSGLYDIEPPDEDEERAFKLSVGRLFDAEAGHGFKSLKVLREI